MSHPMLDGEAQIHVAPLTTEPGVYRPAGSMRRLELAVYCPDQEEFYASVLRLTAAEAAALGGALIAAAAVAGAARWDHSELFYSAPVKFEDRHEA